MLCLLETVPGLGTITGAGGNGATVSLSGAATATTTADASGSYTFSSVTNGSYTVTVSKAGFLYTPASQAITVNGANAAANFSSVAQVFTITGTISGAGDNGATVSLSGAATATTTANASGVYTFSGVTNGFYAVTPSKTGFVFTPASLAVTVNGADVTANFSSAVIGKSHYQSEVKFTPVTFPEVTVVDRLPGRKISPDLVGVTVYEPAVTPVKV
jgi:hypothetical protein